MFNAKGHTVRLDVVQMLLQTIFPKEKLVQLPTYDHARGITNPASDPNFGEIFEAESRQRLVWQGPLGDWQ